MKPNLNSVDHKFIQFNFDTSSTEFVSFGQAEKQLNELIAGGWWLQNSGFVNDGKGFIALLEYIEFEDDDDEEEETWK
jgi:hypothetical protein